MISKWDIIKRFSKRKDIVAFNIELCDMLGRVACKKIEAMLLKIHTNINNSVFKYFYGLQKKIVIKFLIS